MNAFCLDSIPVLDKSDKFIVFQCNSRQHNIAMSAINHFLNKTNYKRNKEIVQRQNGKMIITELDNNKMAKHVLKNTAHKTTMAIKTIMNP